MRVKFVVSHGGEFISLVSVEIGIFLIESEMLVFAKNVPKPKANVKPSAECHREKFLKEYSNCTPRICHQYYHISCDIHHRTFS